MTFDLFQQHLASSYRSLRTGQPLTLSSASDYASRLRTLQRTLDRPLEDASPTVLRSLAGDLRSGAATVDFGSHQFPSDVARALEVYADFLAAAPEPGPSLEPARIGEILHAAGFSSAAATSRDILRFWRGELTLYARMQHPATIVVHPAFEACFATLADAARAGHSGRIRFHHDGSFAFFPKRHTGSRFIACGIAFHFADEEPLRRFIDALEGALLLTDPERPDLTLGAVMKEPETTRQAVIDARRGQGRFRADLLHYWDGRCALTDVSRPELLRASHIKPWTGSSDRERLDMFNGLLLAVHLDALFDRMLITFGDNGEMVVSQNLGDAERKAFGLLLPARRPSLSTQHRAYLAHHRGRFGEAERKGRAAFGTPHL